MRAHDEYLLHEALQANSTHVGLVRVRWSLITVLVLYPLTCSPALETQSSDAARAVADVLNEGKTNS